MIERLARLGYISKGIVYVLIGAFAAAAGRAADKKEALTFILRQPFGRFLLFAIAVGLAGYGVWRFLSGIRDSEKLLVRIGRVVRGLAYGWIAIEVFRFALRQGGASGSDATARHWTARAMDKPFGVWLVAIAGLCIFGYGAYQIVRGIRGKLGKSVHIPRGILTTISRFGIAARGVVFLIIGSSLVFAATRRNPHEAHGISGALREVASQPFGHTLLMIAGIGLVAYGVYAFLNAKYREI